MSSLVDPDSFWIDAYFAETSLRRIPKRSSNPSDGWSTANSFVAMSAPNAQPDEAGLASANPIFTWVRLAQRVPVRIHIDQAPDGVLPGSWHDSYRADSSSTRARPLCGCSARRAAPRSWKFPLGRIVPDIAGNELAQMAQAPQPLKRGRIELQLRYVRITWTAEKRRSYQARYEHPVLITGLCKWWCWPASKIRNIP